MEEINPKEENYYITANATDKKPYLKMSEQNKIKDSQYDHLLLQTPLETKQKKTLKDKQKPTSK